MPTSKQRLTLYVAPELTKRMKHQAIEDGKSLSVITEELWREYLDRRKANH